MATQEVFRFSWTIENVSVWNYDRWILSPHFVVEELGNAAFCLKLNVLGINLGKCSLFLNRMTRDEGPEEVKLKFRFKMSKEPTVHLLKEDVSMKMGGDCGWNDYIANRLVFQSDDWLLLSGDVHVECVILKAETNVHLPAGNGTKVLDGCKGCSARTRFETETVSVKWKIEHFSSLRSGDRVAVEVFSPSRKSPLFLVTLFLSGESPDSETVRIDIGSLERPTGENLTFVACKTTFGEEEGTKTTGIDAHLFNAENACSPWELPVSVRKCDLVDRNKKVVRGDVLTVLLEFKVENGQQFSRIEKAACELVSCAKEPGIERIASNQELSVTKQNLLTLLKDQKLCDVLLETPTKTIGAHKAIICGSSPVFAAMFEHDTLEKSTNAVKVTDVSSATLERFLACLYAERLYVDVDIDVQEASELYFAADKYRVEFLKGECSRYLGRHLSVGNVCAVLSLSDRHQDGDLLESATDFIRRRKPQVFDSREWKALFDADARLVAKVLQRLCQN